MDLVDKIIRYENGEMDNAEAIDFIQELINDGTVWTLQGSYGRMAAALIKNGVCSLPKNGKVNYQPDHDERLYASDK